MAAPRTVLTLSPDAAAKLPDVIRRVAGEGQSTAITPYAPGTSDIYFVPSSQADDGTNVSRWNYTGTLHTTPTGAAISSTTVKGRNTYEARNTSTVRAGLTVTPSSTTCGAIIGIDPARPAVAYPVVGRQVIGGVTYYLFAHPNDPQIKGP